MSEQQGMGSGPFNNGGGIEGLKSGIEAAMKVMGGNNNSQNYMPPEVTTETIDNAALDVRQNAMTIQQKNDIVRNHFNKLELEGERTTQGMAAFEKEVMRRLGR